MAVGPPRHADARHPSRGGEYVAERFYNEVNKALLLIYPEQEVENG